MAPERLLYLLRHAKSSWPAEDVPDRERSLAPRGRRAAGLIGAYLRRHGIEPDLVLCSPALRTRQTLELIEPSLGERAEVQVEDDLYGASAEQLLRRVRQLPDGSRAAMLVGHNPGLQDLALLLAHEGEGLERLREKLPTGALAAIALPVAGWAQVRAGAGRLERFVEPRRLTRQGLEK
jgi:phosphohistidine phosphatase